jgi:DnaK suppressor protein
MTHSKKRASPTPVKSSAAPKRTSATPFKPAAAHETSSVAKRGNGQTKATNGAAKATGSVERAVDIRRPAVAVAATVSSKGASAGKPGGPLVAAPQKPSKTGKGATTLVTPGASKSAAGKKRTGLETAAPTAPAAPVLPRKLPKGGPSKADLRRYRDALLERRRELLSSSSELAAGALQASGGDFSVDHMADHGSDNYEQDFNLKLLEGEADQLAEIRDALLKIDGKLDPPFGVCESCADTDRRLCDTCPWIPASRLDAIPHARLCVQMKEREESVE